MSLITAEIEDQFLITSSLVKVLASEEAAGAASPAGPAIRWSVTSSTCSSPLIRGPTPRHTSTARVSRAVWDSRESCECQRVWTIFSWQPGVGCRVLVLVGSTGRGGGGGDEETRTPDPLLAKEMLFRLSYVPLPCRAVSWEWWAFLDSNQRPLPYQGSALTS